MGQELRSGYTTGTHASAVLGAVLKNYFDKKILESIGVVLPKGKLVDIDVSYVGEHHFKTIKVDNDDLDVTKGCCIHAELFTSKPKNLKEQKPALFEVKNTHFFIYAGDGVGVATKEGLKIAPNSPAINPVPLSMMREMALGIKDEDKRDFHIIISVENGEEIAKETANAKVGVLGGISILGTRGIVKPISADAYLDSIETEIAVAGANGVKNIVFTLGNTSHDYANAHYEELQVIEVGNFVYEASQKLIEMNFTRMTFICGSAKMCKVAQGCKNTHNRFGGINFDTVNLWMADEVGIDFKDEKFTTLKAMLLKLTEEEVKHFVSFLSFKAGKSFQAWFEELEIRTKEIEIITVGGKEIIKRNVKW
ncbi:MAG: cobalt-precorrin-5B (C(1))-methyltransferase [Sulfurimonas sp.]|nr:cobalt-precorrin-5B (C(1))-methyltransferase [Sulfurimonas sp.]PHQ92525.1 MAG: hypothetical protein COB42_01095 [Sulfurimonas sp.]